ncbi:MAG: glycosyltransferase family 4 protein [Saprospiraceae bacterium]|nr:glycosyltransferase family 4 protein [Saprospiraceae bacterium]
MKILIISDYRDTQAAKPEAAFVIGLKQRGAHVDVITYADTQYEKAFLNAGIQILPNHPTKKFDRKFIRYLRELTRERSYNIYYLFNSRAIINGIFAAYSLDVKVVLYRGYTGNIHWYDPTAYFKYLNPRVDKIICIAQSIEEYLHKQWFFDKRKAVTINKGHDPAWYQDISPLELDVFGIPKNAFVVACMGNARPFKGIKYLLQATNECADLADLHLLLIGRDMSKGNLHNMMETSAMSTRIHLTGWRDDVLSILASCHSFVLPSIGGEAITKSLIEAMSMGLAPIATDISGNKGLVIHRQNGLTIPSKNPTAIADAIRALYQQRNLVSAYGNAAKEHIAKHFHTSRTVDETFRLFEELLRG